MSFWRNPEFVRHVRAELRPARALATGLLVLVICALVAISCWNAEPTNLRQFFRIFYLWLLGMQFVVLGLGCASACGQAISRERELKTYDFLKTTRLTPAELLVGKLLGAPVITYFAVACSLPISVPAGILAGYSPQVILRSYLLLAAMALFLGLIGLWTSILLEKSSPAAAVLLASLPVGLGFSFAFSPFPGFGGISVVSAIFSLYAPNSDISRVVPKLFGIPVSFLWLTLLLYAAFGAWFVLMLVRNLKKDFEETRLLSRWQAAGFATFLNVLFYAFLDLGLTPSKERFAEIRPAEVSTFAVGLNAVILFVVGLAMLTPHEKLKVWWRRRAAKEEPYLSDNGLPWPWMALAAVVAYLLLVTQAAALRDRIPLAQWELGAAAIRLLVFLIFTTRDILFLQWCALTRMKRPVVKGVLYLWLYYAAAGIIAGFFGLVSTALSRLVLGLFSPYVVFNPEGIGPMVAPGIYAGMALQMGVIFLLLHAISGRLERPAALSAAPAS